MSGSSDPFLQQIADYYDSNNPDGLSGYVFVFPNRRSSLFFQKYLREAQGTRLGNFNTPFLAPATIAFDDLVDSMSETVAGERSEMLIALYDAYLTVVESMGVPRDGAMELSPFMFWGDVILNDFNEIDLALGDPKEIFRNLRDLKSIETAPLDSDKWELVKQFWDTTGLEHIMENSDEDLWVRHDPERHASKSFVKIWQILGRLYDGFKTKLETMEMHYRGMAVRRLADRLREENERGCGEVAVKYVFAGFGSLSKAEIAVMDALHRRGAAEFFWDVNISFFKENDVAKAVVKQ